MSREIEGSISLRQGSGATGQSTRYKKKPRPESFRNWVPATSYWFVRSRAHTRYPGGLDRLPAGFSARRVLCSSGRARNV